MRALTRANPYYGPLHGVFRELVVLNGVLFQFSTHVKQRSADLDEAMKRHRTRNLFFAAAALIVMDLTELQLDGSPVVFPVGGHIRKGQRYLTMLHEIAAREAAWTVVHGFEVFEVFVKNAAALFLKRNPQQLGAAVWQRRKRVTGVGPATKRLTDHRSFVGLAYRGADDLVKRLGDSLPDLRQAEVHNHRSVCLSDWLVALAAVRHATVHNRGVLSQAQIAKCGPARMKILMASFPGTTTKKGHQLRMKSSDAEEALKILAEYSFLIYKAASQNDALDDQVYRQGRIRV